MNRIKEVLEETGIKQIWLAKSSTRVLALSTPTPATAANPASNSYSKP